MAEKKKGPTPARQTQAPSPPRRPRTDPRRTVLQIAVLLFVLLLVFSIFARTF